MINEPRRVLAICLQFYCLFFFARGKQEFYLIAVAVVWRLFVHINCNQWIFRLPVDALEYSDLRFILGDET